MFPFVQIQRNPWLIHGTLMACLVLFNVAPTTRPDLTSQPACSNVASPNPSPSGAPDKAAEVSSEQRLADDLAYLEAMESHLRDKALKVLTRFTSEACTVDLNLELDPAAVSTTSYEPGDRVLVAFQEKQEGSDITNYKNNVRSENWQLTGVWRESTDVRPRIKSMRVCVTMPRGVTIDNDHLYRCLSYELGIDLHRGDLLQLARR